MLRWVLLFSLIAVYSEGTFPFLSNLPMVTPVYCEKCVTTFSWYDPLCYLCLFDMPTTTTTTVAPPDAATPAPGEGTNGGGNGAPAVTTAAAVANGAPAMTTVPAATTAATTPSTPAAG